jgi:hypothetical protein
VNRWCALVLIGLFAVACGQSTVHSATVSQSRTATSPGVPFSTSNGPVFAVLPAASYPRDNANLLSCSGALGSNDAVAIVNLHNGQTVLRDYSDTAHPRTVCTFPQNAFGRPIDATHLVMDAPMRGDLKAVVDLPSGTPHWFQLPARDADALAVSPRLGAIAWLDWDEPSLTDHLHITTARSDTDVASIPNPRGGRCGGGFSNPGAYTRSGDHLFVLDPGDAGTTQLLVLAGDEIVFRLQPPSGQEWPQRGFPRQALWSPTSETLYYEFEGDVWKWTPAAGAVRFLPGTAWFSPTISADGRYLAYALHPDSSHSDVYLIDLSAASSPRLIGSARYSPRFLNATQLWYITAGVGCGPSGLPKVYDVTDGSEAASVIDYPMSMWPATSGDL